MSEKELYLAQRRRDAERELTAAVLLCASASLRELTWFRRKAGLGNLWLDTELSTLSPGGRSGAELLASRQPATDNCLLPGNCERVVAGVFMKGVILPARRTAKA